MKCSHCGEKAQVRVGNLSFCFTCLFTETLLKEVNPTWWCKIVMFHRHVWPTEEQLLKWGCARLQAKPTLIAAQKEWACVKCEKVPRDTTSRKKSKIVASPCDTCPNRRD